LAMIEEIINDVDYVLVMSVNPGFGGQKFIQSSLDKLRRLRALIQSHGSRARIEIDGGISTENAAAVVAAGAEILVAGSAIFGKPDPAEAARQLLGAASAQANVKTMA